MIYLATEHKTVAKLLLQKISRHFLASEHIWTYTTSQKITNLQQKLGFATISTFFRRKPQKQTTFIGLDLDFCKFCVKN